MDANLALEPARACDGQQRADLAGGGRGHHSLFYALGQSRYRSFVVASDAISEIRACLCQLFQS